MRALRILTAVALATILSGCWVLSIEPLYTSDDLVFEPSLVGVWAGIDGDEDESWTFLPLDSSSYRLVTTESGAPDAVFEAHLLRLGGHLYLDLLPEEPEEMNEFQLGHLIPAHSFWTVSLQGNVLVLDVMDTERLKRVIDSTGADIGHLERDHAIVLTATTGELQTFVTDFMGEMISGDPLTLERAH